MLVITPPRSSSLMPPWLIRALPRFIFLYMFLNQLDIQVGSTCLTVLLSNFSYGISWDTVDLVSMSLDVKSHSLEISVQRGLYPSPGSVLWPYASSW